MFSTSSANLTCLCGAIIAPGSILSGPVIPISFEMCHCNTCRYTHGSLGTSFAPLSSSPTSDVLSKLTAYHSSQKATRYFCSTCGCHCFHHNKRIKQWFCLGGIIEPNYSLNENAKSWPKDLRARLCSRYTRRGSGSYHAQPWWPFHLSFTGLN
jgi:hypothetical protein